MSYAKYACITCDLVYDEALGWPDEGFPPGTLWKDIPDDWMCPDCSASKDDFYLVE